jgi:hypothetical protein
VEHTRRPRRLLRLGRRDERRRKGEGEGQEDREEGLTASRWDKSKDSLSSTLHPLFPEIFPKTDIPEIPDHPS